MRLQLPFHKQVTSFPRTFARMPWPHMGTQLAQLDDSRRAIPVHFVTGTGTSRAEIGPNRRQASLHGCSPAFCVQKDARKCTLRSASVALAALSGFDLHVSRFSGSDGERIARCKLTRNAVHLGARFGTPKRLGRKGRPGAASDSVTKRRSEGQKI